MDAYEKHLASLKQPTVAAIQSAQEDAQHVRAFTSTPMQSHRGPQPNMQRHNTNAGLRLALDRAATYVFADAAEWDA